MFAALAVVTNIQPAFIAELKRNWLELVLGVSMIGASITAGVNLRKRKRSAGIAALATIAIPLAERLASGNLSVGAIVAGALHIWLIGAVWKELE